MLEGRIVAADPQKADDRRRAEEAVRFVATGTCNQFGLKTLIAKATAGDVIWLDAMCDRIAAMLAALGDEETLQVRRSKALGLLGHPLKVLALFAEYDGAVRSGRVDPVETAEDPAAVSDDSTDFTDSTDSTDSTGGGNLDRPDATTQSSGSVGLGGDPTPS